MEEKADETRIPERERERSLHLIQKCRNRRSIHTLPPPHGVPFQTKERIPEQTPPVSCCRLQNTTNGRWHLLVPVTD